MRLIESIEEVVLEHGSSLGADEIRTRLIEGGHCIRSTAQITVALSAHARTSPSPRLVATRDGGWAHISQNGTKVPGVASESAPRRLIDRILALVQHEGKPMHFRDIAQRLLDSGEWHTDAQDPAAVVNALASAACRMENGTLIRTAPGIYAHPDATTPGEPNVEAVSAEKLLESRSVPGAPASASTVEEEVPGERVCAAARVDASGKVVFELDGDTLSIDPAERKRELIFTHQGHSRMVPSVDRDEILSWFPDTLQGKLARSVIERRRVRFFSSRPQAAHGPAGWRKVLTPFIDAAVAEVDVDEARSMARDEFGIGTPVHDGSVQANRFGRSRSQHDRHRKIMGALAGLGEITVAPFLPDAGYQPGRADLECDLEGYELALLRRYDTGKEEIRIPEPDVYQWNRVWVLPGYRAEDAMTEHFALHDRIPALVAGSADLPLVRLAWDDLVLLEEGVVLAPGLRLEGAGIENVVRTAYLARGDGLPGAMRASLQAAGLDLSEIYLVIPEPLGRLRMRIAEDPNVQTILLRGVPDVADDLFAAADLGMRAARENGGPGEPAYTEYPIRSEGIADALYARLVADPERVARPAALAHVREMQGWADSAANWAEALDGDDVRNTIPALRAASSYLKRASDLLRKTGLPDILGTSAPRPPATTLARGLLQARAHADAEICAVLPIRDISRALTTILSPAGDVLRFIRAEDAASDQMILVFEVSISGSSIGEAAFCFALSDLLDPAADHAALAAAALARTEVRFMIQKAHHASRHRRQRWYRS